MNRKTLAPKRPQQPLPAPLRIAMKWLWAAWVAGSLLFAHGCHGDEDHELFAAWIGRAMP